MIMSDGTVIISSDSSGLRSGLIEALVQPVEVLVGGPPFERLGDLLVAAAERQQRPCLRW